MRRVSLRELLRIAHRWLGLLLFALVLPIALSGALLVFDGEIDALISPHRYRVSGAATLAPSAYLAAARSAAGEGVAPIAVRYPESGSGPVTVQARGNPAGEGMPPRLLTVYLDPPTARVLDVADFRSSFIGVMHRLHENLTVPQYSGRAIVGWVGVAMLGLALSGIVLWWPRSAGLMRALRWRRRPATSANLHYTFGFWISLPLAFVSLTGIYLAFPPQARSLMSAIAATSPAGGRSLAPPARQTALSADHAFDAGRAAVPAARPLALFVPSAARGADAPPAVWRVLLQSAGGETVTVLVDDRKGEATRQPAPLAGDRAGLWIRWLHEGSHSGTAWRLIVLLTGIFPPVLGTTGIIMWLRGRRGRAQASRSRAGALQAAE